MNRNPTPEEIRAARRAAGLTQKQAAQVVRVSTRCWQNWESKSADASRSMQAGMFELFILKTTSIANATIRVNTCK